MVPPERLLDVAVVSHLLQVGARPVPDEMIIGSTYSGEKRWIRCLGLDKDMGGIDDLDFLNHLFHIGHPGRPFESGCVLPHERLDVRPEVFGSGGSPVLPFGLRVERQENPFGRLLPFRSPQRNHLHVLIPMHQAQIQIALQQTSPEVLPRIEHITPPAVEGNDQFVDCDRHIAHSGLGPGACSACPGQASNAEENTHRGNVHQHLGLPEWLTTHAHTAFVVRKFAAYRKASCGRLSLLEAQLGEHG